MQAKNIAKLGLNT